MPNNWGDPSWGNSFAAGGTTGQDPTRNENVYALRDTDTPSQWAQRVWAQSTADYGRNNLNPYTAQNPNANSPYARWYQSRYGTAAPTNVFTNNLVANQPMTSQNVANQLNTMQKTGTPAGPGTGYNDINAAKGQLDQVGSMVNQFSQGNNGSFSPAQTGMLGQVMNDPSMSTQMILSALQGGEGGWGLAYQGNQLQNLANQYYNDPGNQGPQAAGPFFNQALKLLGV